MIKNKKIINAFIGIILSCFLFFCFSFGYQITNKIICNLIYFENKQIISFSNKNNYQFTIDQKINLTYDNKSFNSIIIDINSHLDLIYIEIDKYIEINKGDMNLYINLEQLPLLFIVIKNIF